MAGDEVDATLADYDQIVASVTAISAGQGPTVEGSTAVARLRGRLEPVIDGRRGDSLLADAAGARVGAEGLGHDEIAANAAVLLFGGIETTEGMIANALREILTHSGELERVRNDPGALDGVIDESLPPRASRGRDRPLCDPRRPPRRGADRPRRSRPDLAHGRQPRSGGVPRSRPL